MHIYESKSIERPMICAWGSRLIDRQASCGAKLPSEGEMITLPPSDSCARLAIEFHRPAFAARPAQAGKGPFFLPMGKRCFVWASDVLHTVTPSKRTPSLAGCAS